MSTTPRHLELVPDGATRPSGRSRAALALGAALGLALALGSILQPREKDAMPSDAVATVNGVAIRTAELERAVAALAADRRDPLAANDQRRILDRLVEEELLVQRARELGLDRRDRGLRSRLVTAMVETILADAKRADPSEDDLAAFYRDNASFFVPASRAWVRELKVEAGEGRSEEEAHDRAAEAVRRLRAGEEFAAVAAALGDRAIAPLPDGPLPAATLREYLGPTLTARALALEPGGVSDLLRGPTAFHVLQLVALERPPPPPLAAVESEIRSEMRRRADEEALRAYLDDLRRQATVVVRQP